MKIKRTYSAEETKKIGEELAREVLLKKPKGKAVIISLFGNLGSGKTTFVQGFLKGAGWRKRVTSPTFIIMRRFPLRRKNFKNVYHLDAYRLKPSDVQHLAFEDLKKDPKNVILVEWPENLLKRKMWKIKIWFLHGEKENERVIKMG
jgi:tRNA threonylcarbamoyladenosine biosynthesis protein TsaE